MPYKVVFRADVVVEGDVAKIQRSKLRGVIEALAAHPEIGKPLSGALSGYRSTRIGGSQGRVVYRIIEDRQEVEVVAMGQRRDSHVYDVAVGRLT